MFLITDMRFNWWLFVSCVSYPADCEKIKTKIGLLLWIRIQSCLSGYCHCHVGAGLWWFTAHALDTGFRGALRFDSSLKAPAHHFLLFERVWCSSLSSRGLKCWCILIYKVVWGLLPLNLLNYIKQKSTALNNIGLEDLLLLSVTKVQTELATREV